MKNHKFIQASHVKFNTVCSTALLKIRNMTVAGFSSYHLHGFRFLQIRKVIYDVMNYDKDFNGYFKIKNYSSSHQCKIGVSSDWSLQR